MKVKVIASYDLKKFEIEINEFIKDKIVIDIKYTPNHMYTEFSMSSRGGVAPTKSEMMYNALIMYEEKEEFIDDDEPLENILNN